MVQCNIWYIWYLNLSWVVGWVLAETDFLNDCLQNIFFSFVMFVSYYKVPTPRGKSWIFFPVNSGIWKVLEIKAQGPGKSWKYILENRAFFRRFKWKSLKICRASLLYMYLNICGLQKGPGKCFMGSWKVLIKSWIFCQ